MRLSSLAVLSLGALLACGGATASVSDAGADGASSSSSGSGSGSGSSSGSGSGSGSSSGGSNSSSGSGSSSGGSSSSSGGSSSSSGSARTPVNHRPNDMQCQTTPAPGNCQFTGQGAPCTMDSQCTAGTDGRCVMLGGPVVSCQCTYDACMHDGDCATGSTCVCHGSPYVGGEGNTCVAGNCRVDADCGPSGYCSPAYDTMSCGGLLGYFCHTAGDQCVDDADCQDAGTYDYCTYSQTASRWQCGAAQLCP